jgi:hypothetical protein
MSLAVPERVIAVEPHHSDRHRPIDYLWLVNPRGLTLIRCNPPSTLLADLRGGCLVTGTS